MIYISVHLLIQIEESTKVLATLRWPKVYLCGVNNRGRDIAPFLLDLLPEALRTGHLTFDKVHTKITSP